MTARLAPIAPPHPDFFSYALECEHGRTVLHQRIGEGSVTWAVREVARNHHLFCQCPVVMETQAVAA